VAAIAQWGGYSSADNETNLVRYQMARTYSPRGKKLQETRRIHLESELIYSTTDLIIAAANNVITNFSQNYKDFRYTVNGTLAHSLLNGADCVSGVKVVATSFPHGSPEQLATTRTWWVDLEATYDACDDDLVSWEDAIETVGTGGPYDVLFNTISGPVAFRLSNTTAQMYTQRGSAVGYTTWPDTPGPVNPSGEFAFRRRITDFSGKQLGKGLRFFRRSWTYYMYRDVNTFGFGSFYPTSK
jgi:hypothetical protein